ncbi:MAG: hypothetical protein ACE5KP_04855 [Dehalococcoidales bacterium]
MRDKSLGILLMVLFGIAGITVLLLAWLWPMPGSERIMTTFVGVFGLGVALSQVASVKSAKPRADTEQVMIKVLVQDKP